jgi:hypothetical protein
MLLDADERFYPTHRYLRCNGTPTPNEEVDRILRHYDFRSRPEGPDWSIIGQLGANLSVDASIGVYDQGQWLRHQLNADIDAIITVRRHWHDLSFKRPTQSWVMMPDWQMRVVRNDPSIYFDPDTKMHERLCGVNSYMRADLDRGPFFDHHHFWFKRMEPEQRRHDVQIYDAIHAGKPAPARPE